MKEIPNNFPTGNQDEKPLDNEIEMTDKTNQAVESEAPKTESEEKRSLEDIELSDEVAIKEAMLKLENAYAKNNEQLPAGADDDFETMGAPDREIEAMETSPELQEYIESVQDIMKSEFEGMDFDPNAEAIEKPKKSRAAKALLLVTAGVMLWMSSVTAFVDTAEAKSSKKKDYSFGEIFDTNIKKTTKGLKKIPQDVAKKTTRDASKEITKATQKAINNVLDSIFK